MKRGKIFEADTYEYNTLRGLKKALPFITPSITLLIIIVTGYFISSSGQIRRAKWKIKLEDIEHKIRFHRNNRILLSIELLEGYKNNQWTIIKRDELLNDIKEEKPIDLNCLIDISGLIELDKFVKEYQEKYIDPFPFYMNDYHISFIELNKIYDEVFSRGKRPSKLNSMFLTKENMEIEISNWYKYIRGEFLRII